MRRVRRPLLALIVLVAALAIGYGVRALSGGPAHPATVPVSTLPPQARQTLALIRHHGPFPYPEDGETFHNYEHQLPAKPDGWYHEYTVTTPGAPDRGARRLVIGHNGVTYYTDDHYDTFERVTGAGVGPQ